MNISDFCEILMLCMFGASWPFNVVKSYKARTTEGRSLLFLLLILGGYICGIIAKLNAPSYKWYVLAFYIFNLTAVSADLLLYRRNAILDKQRKSVVAA